jgi:hypothetical protein
MLSVTQIHGRTYPCAQVLRTFEPKLRFSKVPKGTPNMAPWMTGAAWWLEDPDGELDLDHIVQTLTDACSDIEDVVVAVNRFAPSDDDRETNLQAAVVLDLTDD